ncbi:cysteine synthase CysM [candidate division KSB1 bacterium]|nr:cysteine synthase CysM [candidate division KSB1 bacterium]RQW00018.1 MAG: cysteine synthase CysM [candidate division KSB1 bacterium]
MPDIAYSNQEISLLTVLDLIGNTPLVELKNLNPNPESRIFAKLEGQNPAGSVKDRPACFMIKGALERGELSSGKKFIEATSGNTGIALAMIARQFGLDIELVMPEGSTEERIKTMRAFGATVFLTAREHGIEGSIDYVNEKMASGDYVMLNQFANPDNPRAHFETTGPEIWRATNGRITHFVASMGTTGTIMGTGRYLKRKNAKIKIIGVQPEQGSAIPGIRNWPAEYVPKIFDPSGVDDIRYVSQRIAVDMTRRLARDEGIFAGMSSGGAAFIALQLAGEIDHGTIVFIVCDRGDRYLSTDLFAGS